MYNATRGYGFIQSEQNGVVDKVFFHIRNWVDKGQPIVGGVVEYLIGAPISLEKKYQAVQVRYPEPEKRDWGLQGGGA